MNVPPPTEPDEAVRALVVLMATLRTSCPWDRVQTHGTLRRHLLEEAHEVLEALDHLEALDAVVAADADATTTAALEMAYGHLAEELGDLLFQVVFHADLASEQDRFDLADVAQRVHDKLVARHPHVFVEPTSAGPDTDAATADLVVGWEQAKVAEKGRSSVMDGVPATLPALALAAKIIGKSEAVAPDLVPADAGTEAPVDEQELGRHLLEVVAVARRHGLDAEAALRSAAHELERAVREREAAD